MTQGRQVKRDWLLFGGWKLRIYPLGETTAPKSWKENSKEALGTWIQLNTFRFPFLSILDFQFWFFPPKSPPSAPAMALGKTDTMSLFNFNELLLSQQQSNHLWVRQRKWNYVSPHGLLSFTCFLILMDVSTDLIVNQHNIWLINKKHQTEGVLMCRISGSWGIYSAIAGSVLEGGRWVILETATKTDVCFGAFNILIFLPFYCRLFSTLFCLDKMCPSVKKHLR